MLRKAAGTCTATSRRAAPAVLLTVARSFIEHSSDPKQWRNKENDEIRRQFEERMYKTFGDQQKVGGQSSSGGGATTAERKPEFFRGPKGVPLGSDRVLFEAREKRERELIAEDNFTDWDMYYWTGLGVVVVVFLLNALLYVGEPVPSPTYVPYEVEQQRKREEEAAAAAAARGIRPPVDETEEEQHFRAMNENILKEKMASIASLNVEKK